MQMLTVCKVGQVLHIECKFEMTIYPQNHSVILLLRCCMQNSDDLSSPKREMAIFPSISPPWCSQLLLLFRLPHEELGSSHHLSSSHRQSRSMTCQGTSWPLLEKKANPTDNFVVSRIHYPFHFLHFARWAKRQSARAGLYCETRRGHTHFLPLPWLPGFLITPHKTFNEISEDGEGTG